MFLILPEEIILYISNMVGNPYDIAKVSKFFNQEYKFTNMYSHSVNNLLVHRMFFRFNNQSDWLENKLLYCYNNIDNTQEVIAFYIYYKKNNKVKPGKSVSISFYRNMLCFGKDFSQDLINVLKDFINGVTPFPVARRY